MLYHYTNFAAFDSIIRCAELRLNNILNMNDTSEMRLFMNGICKAVSEVSFIFKILFSRSSAQRIMLSKAAKLV